MSGKRSRRKGKKGELEARNLLTDRDYTILANTSDGTETEDIIVSYKGVVYSVEVKNNKLINVPAIKKQAMVNAKKKKLAWMIMCKLDNSRSWLVWQKNNRPVIWHEKVE